jgi:ABC-2 type transport system ATP-binding protein
LRNQTNGSITLLGQELPAKGKIREHIGVVLQETALYEELTIFENLSFSASLYNVPNPAERIMEVLDLLKLRNRSDQTVRTLSGGLRRRVAIARALLHNPELLIIDEPTLGVDSETRHSIWLYLRLLRSKGVTIIIATNYLDEVQALCNSVVVLREGRLIAFESPDALVAKSGYCIDLECGKEECKKIKEILTSEGTVLCTEESPSGLSIFIENNSAQEPIISLVLKSNLIESFRVRAPDLAEVFKALEERI